MTDLEPQQLGHGLAVGAGVGRARHAAELGVQLTVVVPGRVRVLRRVLYGVRAWKWMSCGRGHWCEAFHT